MTKAEIARQAAIDRVGDAYVYGAWDQQCTVANRNRYANLKSEYKDAIKNQCPRMKSNKNTCTGCKYEGRRIHDCRGLTSACAKAAGIVIDGSTVARQWNADVWERKGTIDSLPEELPYVQLFRYNGSKWAHTGIYIGNGETVDARGHVYGVIRKKLSDYKWTHWAIPKGMYEEIPDDAGGEQAEMEDQKETAIGRFEVVVKEGSYLNVRTSPSTSANKVRRGDSKLYRGDIVEVFELLDNSGTVWAKIMYEGAYAYVSGKYLAVADENAGHQAADQGTDPPVKDEGEEDPVILTARLVLTDSEGNRWMPVGDFSCSLEIVEGSGEFEIVNENDSEGRD